MTTILGLDIGTNSVGSALVDTDKRAVRAGVSVFPAGVVEKDEGRGEPKNQSRRQKRSLRRSLARRSARKRKLRMFLREMQLLPIARDELQSLFAIDAWQLRRKGLEAILSPYEFGRVLVHLCQRRGALGLKLPEPEEEPTEAEAGGKKKGKKEMKAEPDSDGVVKDAVASTKKQLSEHKARTFGELMAILSEQRRSPVLDKEQKPKRNEAGELVTFSHRIRNEDGNFEFHADRIMLRDEFKKLWNAQASYDSQLSKLLTEELKKQLDDPTGDGIWRHRGLLFGQRRTYWNTGTLGRCDLEPSDQCVSIADRHASYYRVLETVNNIRIHGPRDQDFRPLTFDERQKVISKLRSQKTGTVATVREALGIDKRTLKKHDIPVTAFVLNLERDEDREINTDWFHREIVLNGIGEATWNGWDDAQREGLNRALLRFDPTLDEDAVRIAAVAGILGLDTAATERLLAGWRSRPKLEKRLKLSRRAVSNLVPFMESCFTNWVRGKAEPIQVFRLNEEAFSPTQHRWLTQIEAREAFALELSAAANCGHGKVIDPAIKHQIRRYELGGSRNNKRDRYYMKKHPELFLPPAPTLSNPVVRKAIHEVRRHVIAHIRANGGKKPDRIVIEFARETTKSAKLSDEIMFRNRHREKIRRRIREELIEPAHGSMYHSLSTNQLRAAEDRVILCLQQRHVCAYSLDKLTSDTDGSCAYSGRAITLRQAALGSELEVDHIIPYSRCGDNSLNNRVLCYRDANRNKSNQTPREWWGNDFDDRIRPMSFMDGFEPDKKADYFSKREYGSKWRNLSRNDVPSEWKGSQLSDTAYAAKEVQSYLQQSLWPDEPSHLAADSSRRIFVTKGAYTSQLRRDWQLYKKTFSEAATRVEREQAAAKDRGDHREHAIDAVVIALTDTTRIQELARIIKFQQEAWMKAKNAGTKPEHLKRLPLATPWGNAKTFRRQVLSLIYDDFVDSGDENKSMEKRQAMVVSHRPVGRKLTGKLHEETLFGPVPNDKTSFTGFIRITELDPNHLRLPVREKPKDAIERLAAQFLDEKSGIDSKKAKKLAKAFVESKGFSPKLVDPPPGKSGLVRDIGMRRILCNAINERLRSAQIDRDATTFTERDLKLILNPINSETNKPEFRTLTMPSGVPIKRLVLLRTMNEPIVVTRKQWNQEAGKWEVDSSNRAARAYVGGNNHHIAIREDTHGDWSGEIVSTYEASVRARIEKVDPVDRTDDPQRGGRFVMSLSEGETVYMRHKETGEPGFFVVFKLDKPHTIQFKNHWDARRAKGEKDESGILLSNSQRDAMPVSAVQLKDLAPLGEATPIKVIVDPLGRVHRVEPLPPRDDQAVDIDPRVMAIARDAVTARKSQQALGTGEKKRRQHGSWTSMRARLKREGLEDFASQLSAGIRQLKIEIGDAARRK